MFLASGRPGRWLGVATLGTSGLGAILTLHPGTLLSVAVASVTLAMAITAAPKVSDRLRSRGLLTWRARVALTASVPVGAVGAVAGLGASGLLLWTVLLGAAWLLAPDTTEDVKAVNAAEATDAVAGPILPWSSSGTGSSDGATCPAERGAGPAGLSDSELCWAWRNSYFAAQRAASNPESLDRVSRARRGYLDEMQRRDPQGFATWLDAGARAASDPARYLKGTP